MPPKPKGKGRGRGAGRGRGKGRGQHLQQETRPGRAAASTPDPPSSSESPPSLSQKSEQPEGAQMPQRKEQKRESDPGEEALTKALATSQGQRLNGSLGAAAPSHVVEQKQGKKRGGEKKQQQSPDQGQKQPLNLSGEDAAVRVQTPESDKRPGGAAAKPDVINKLADTVVGVTITHVTGHANRQPDLHPPRRPDFGRAGRPINLFANFFKLQIPSNEFMYHYDVEIEPSKCPRHIKHQVINAVINEYKNTFCGRRPAFDGQKNIYSREKLLVGKNGVTLEVGLPGEDGGRDRKFKVTIKFAANVNLSELTDFLHGRLLNDKLPQDSIQSMDIVLRQQPNLCYTAVGRSFFPPPGAQHQPAPLGGGCEVWFGFYQSVRPSQWKTMLVNIDVSAKGFYKEQEVIELLCETVRKRENEIADRRFEMDRYTRDDFTQELKGLRIVTTHSKEFKRKYTVKGLSRQSASTLRFNISDEKTGKSSETTVERYFSDRYNLTLRYPHLPCLEVGKDKFVPMEVCKLIPCPKRKLTDDQIATMIKHTARPARERQKNIQSWAAECQRISGKYLKDEFGISMSKNMERVEGRVLDPPAIQLGEKSKQRQLTPREGSWDMREKTFFSGREITKWAMFCYLPKQRCNATVLENFSKQLMFFSGKAGMPIKNEPCDVKYIRKQETNKIFDTTKRNHPDLQLILAVIPDKNNKDIYDQVKQVGDVILGVATQCVQFKQAQGAKPQVCSNIAMKINAKMGGVNHIVDPAVRAPVLREPVIIFGADVTHPSPGDTKTPSIAALVASLDPNASRYCATVRVQDHRQEIIEELAEMVKELLKQFYKKTHKKPLKIIFYRDGVSEGQFDQVLKHEVRAVQEACMMLEKGYQPGITFVVVQKRHHVRLFPADGRDACGRAGNIPPGTTVDQGITHPFEFDFYLCSHFGIQGTSRPTHYHVIYDDNNFNADSLQQLTYQLCHTFARCPRSVSMPAPAYYAHLAAFRARNHLADQLRLSNGTVADNLQKFAAAVKVQDKMASEMYFT